MSNVQQPAAEPAPTDFNLQLVLDTIDLPAFAIDADDRVVAWDEQIATLLGFSREEVLGVQGLGDHVYDEPGKQTLAEKVLEVPQSAHREFDSVGLADEEYALLNANQGEVYEDTSTLGGQDIWFIATPVYYDGELIGVLEIVQDIADSARHQRELEALFDALIDTIESYEQGHFEDTVAFDTTETVLSEQLLRIIDSVDEMGDEIADILSKIDADIVELDDAADDIAYRSQQINDTATEQASDMETISAEVANLSATVEEIASTADEVEETSTEAEDLAEAGSESAEEAIGAMETVGESAHNVADDVDRLQDRMAEIDEIVEVINDIADQTNMLALNASIEAARAGEAGEGFAVVADEVKSLAEESQGHASDIEEMVHQIRAETDETVANLQETTEQVDDGIEQVEEAMLKFEDIVGAVKDTAQGIEQVADATDDQAASAEEIASMVDEAVEKAETVSEEVEGIVADTEQQAAMAAEISEEVNRLTGNTNR